MRNLLITLLMVCTLHGWAQVIEIPLSNRTADVYLRDTNIVVGVIPANTGQVDSFATVNTRFPTFVAESGYITYNQIENAWSNRQYKNSEYVVNGLVYKPEKTKYFALLKNRYGLALVQKFKIYQPQMAEKTDIEKVYYLYQYAIDNNYPISTLNNYQGYIDLIDKVNGVVIPIDTIPQDSIK